MSVIANRSLNFFKCYFKKYSLESDVFTEGSIKLMNVLNIQKRNLNLLEHVSYQLLNQYGIKTPRYGVAKSAAEAKKIYEDLKVTDCVIKAQVLTGGRQLGHFKKGFRKGVHTATSADEVAEIAGKMIGDYIITKQTGAQGLPCSKVMITERKFPRREFYFSVIMDRKFDGPAVIASSQGGTSIEDVAAQNPEAIIMEPVDIKKGLSKEKALEVCKKVGMKGKAAENTAGVLQNLFQMFMEKDATLLEMNPYIEDTTGDYICLDAKCRFDDSAAYRQRELFALRDLSQEKKVEIEASKRDLNYIQLDGHIGCLVNGAGLAMATMDIIKLYGGEPANFLDVGGQATLETIQFALELIMNDKGVEVIFVNIFGGIMRCDIIATGLVTAVQQMKLETPIVVRLLGTNVTQAKEIISKAKLKLITIDNFDEAAKVSATISTILGLARKANIKISVQ